MLVQQILTTHTYKFITILHDFTEGVRSVISKNDVHELNTFKQLGINISYILFFICLIVLQENVIADWYKQEKDKFVKDLDKDKNGFLGEFSSFYLWPFKNISVDICFVKIIGFQN